MQGEIEGVIRAEDIECIHRMRVASRRLRNALNIFQNWIKKREYNAWMADIRKITRSLGAARDIDVQVSFISQMIDMNTDSRLLPGLRRLLLRLNQKREVHQKSVILCMEEIRSRAVLDTMHASLSANILDKDEHTLSADLYHLSYQTIHQRLGDFLSYQDIIHFPEKKQELHNMRIAAKWLRYSLETFSPLYSSNLKNSISTCRESQEILGKIHDNDVWISFLPQFMEKEKERTLKYYGYLRPYYRMRPGLEYFLENLITDRDEVYKKFLGRWQKWQRINVWEELESTIKIPLIDAETIYPPSEGSNTAIDFENPE